MAPDMSKMAEPVGEFCKGDVALGSGCLRCGRCAVQLAGEVARLKAGAHVPEFHSVAASKLKDMQERGYKVTGYALEKPVEGALPSRGFVDAGGFVGWWRGDDEWNATVARAVELKLKGSFIGSTHTHAEARLKPRHAFIEGDGVGETLQAAEKRVEQADDAFKAYLKHHLKAQPAPQQQPVARLTSFMHTPIDVDPGEPELQHQVKMLGAAGALGVGEWDLVPVLAKG